MMMRPLLRGCISFILFAVAACAKAPSVAPDLTSPPPTHASFINSPSPTAASQPPTPSPAPTPTSFVEEKVARAEIILTPQVTTTCGLRVEDFTLGSAQDFNLPANTDFAAQLPQALFESQQAARQYATQTITQTNHTLAAFGYRLEEEPGTGITLYQGDRMIKEGLPGFSPVTLSQSGADFVMVAGAWDNAWLVRKGSLEKWDPSAHFQQTPRFLGDDLLLLSWRDIDPDSGAMGVVVERNNEPIFKQVLAYTGPEGCPVVAFDAWNGHWALEAENDIFLDGDSLNQKMSYQQSFDWALVKGKPFYVFQKDGKYGMAYGDKILSIQFDDVIHPDCVLKKGTGSPYTDGTAPDLVWFYARSRDSWHYIQISPKPG